MKASQNTCNSAWLSGENKRHQQAFDAMDASHCPCGGDTRVYDSRDEGQRIVRRRECLTCGKRWKTYEVHAEAIEAMEAVQESFESVHDAMAAACQLFHRTRNENARKLQDGD